MNTGYVVKMAIHVGENEKTTLLDWTSILWSFHQNQRMVTFEQFNCGYKCRMVTSEDYKISGNRD